MSGSRRDQPMELIESRKDVEAMLADLLHSSFGSRLYRVDLEIFKCTR